MGVHKKVPVIFMYANRMYEIPVAQGLVTRFEQDHEENSLSLLLRLLMEECHSFSELGRKFGRSHEAIRKIYVKYLAPYSANPGVKRRRVCTLKRIHLPRFPDHILKVWRKARRAGIEVSAVNSLSGEQKNVHTLTRHLFFNDVLGTIRHTTFKHPNVDASQVYFNRKELEQIPLHILFFEVPGFQEHMFILRSCDLLPLFKKMQKRKTFYVPLFPLDGSIPKRKKRKYDLMQYMNAWHLITTV